jgi:hypothetical protein
LVVNNSRLYVLPDGHYPNRVSRFMKLMLGRLSQDWESTWGHPVALAESFVDPQEYRGTAYKVSGWSPLGPTRGWKRRAVDFYEQHDRPKQVWIRELDKDTPACSSAPRSGRPRGPRSKRTPRPTARPRRPKSAVWSERCGPRCRSAAPNTPWSIRWAGGWRSSPWRCSAACGGGRRIWPNTRRRSRQGSCAPWVFGATTTPERSVARASPPSAPC